MNKKHKILIANRGEIAIRIAQACMKLDLEFVCVYTQPDEFSGHCKMAKNMNNGKNLYRVSSYNDANEIFAVADESGATAVHPGYGFFAEDYHFARRAITRNNPLIFIGPSWKVIQELGDKINTKRLARKLGVPTVPGSDRPIVDDLEAERMAEQLFVFQEYNGVANPLILVKAAAGGGGMGIEEVDDLDKFRLILRRVKDYAKRQFHDESVLIEQRIFDFNHLEVQILADRAANNPVHFGTRNCTIQSIGRQKRVEIAPGFSPEVLKYNFDANKVLNDITEYSLRIARAAKYDSVGTWEWIVSPEGNPFLMEVNTRIQVENGVSASIARVKGQKINLIAEQIRTALGEPLNYTQQDIEFEGIGIEYRIIAEDPDNKFAPQVGKIVEFSWEEQPWLQIHTQVPVDEPYEIPTDFDPNLALAIIWGNSLDEVKLRGKEFLNKLKLVVKDSFGQTLSTNVRYLHRNTDNILVF